MARYKSKRNWLKIVGTGLGAVAAIAGGIYLYKNRNTKYVRSIKGQEYDSPMRRVHHGILDFKGKEIFYV